ncbi:MAG: hypothetical protein R3Y63_10740 [Eubacteriales bacterium]
MENFRLLPVIMLLIFTVSCGTSREEVYHQEALLARSAYLSLEQGTGICHINADYGERVYDFSLVLTLSQNNGIYHCQLSLTAPEEIAGIVATQEGLGGDSKLMWDGMILETGDLDDDGLSPMTAIPLLLETLSSGYLEGVTLKDNGVLELYSRNPDSPTGQGREVVLWLNPDSYALLGGEIFQDGKRVISCKIENFVMA